MDKKGSIKEEIKSKLILTSNNIIFIARWFAILIVIPLFYSISDNNIGSLKFFIFSLVAMAIYNLLISIKGFKKTISNKKTFDVFIIIDVCFICLFSYLMGGVKSDIYIIIIFIIGYCAIFNNVGKILKICLLSILLYVFSTIMTVNQIIDLDISSLFMRVFFISAAGVGVVFVSREIKRFDEMHKKEYKLARTDKLTGLANRHFLDFSIQEGVEYSIATKKPLNIFIFDIDNFKRFNDTYGHIWGDKLLALFADIIMQNIRKTDVAVRYGGEEFLLLVKDLSLVDSKNVAERIRRHLERQKIVTGRNENNGKVTVSGGIAQFPKHSTDIQIAIECADKALYRAKERGKNMVVTYDELIDTDKFKEKRDEST